MMSDDEKRLTPLTKDLPHPIQSIGYDDNGVIRFKENAIVNYLLDEGYLNLNDIAIIPFSNADRTQFAQLIGYSVSGGAGLSYFLPEQRIEADAIADAIYKNSESSITPDPKDAIIQGLREELQTMRNALNAQLAVILNCTPEQVSGYIDF